MADSAEKAGERLLAALFIPCFYTILVPSVQGRRYPASTWIGTWAGCFSPEPGDELYATSNAIFECHRANTIALYQ
jgi:hypothetical protein